MASAEQIINLNTDEWVEILVDPDTDGYIGMIIQKKSTNHGKLAWSLINSLADTVEMPNPLLVNYPIFIKNLSHGTNGDIEITVKRV